MICPGCGGEVGVSEACRMCGRFNLVRRFGGVTPAIATCPSGCDATIAALTRERDEARAELARRDVEWRDGQHVAAVLARAERAEAERDEAKGALAMSDDMHGEVRRVLAAACEAHLSERSERAFIDDDLRCVIRRIVTKYELNLLEAGTELTRLRASLTAAEERGRVLREALEIIRDTCAEECGHCDSDDGLCSWCVARAALNTAATGRDGEGGA